MSIIPLPWSTRLTRGAAFVVLVLSLLSVALPARSAPRLPDPARWPLAGTPSVTAGFDPPSLPWGRGHRGLDLAARVGDPVLAAADGTVAFAGPVAGRQVLVLDHGGVQTTYEPVSPRVRVGDPVGLGEVVGTVGTGSHCPAGCLHWGLKEGATYHNPLDLLTGTARALRLVPTDLAARVTVASAERALTSARLAQSLLAASVPTSARPGRHHFGWPVDAGVTSGFGLRLHPVLHRWKLHDGTDLGAACGVAIRAPYGGVVSRLTRNSAYGNRLFLTHGTVDGRQVVSGYNHATAYVVATGQHVSAGQVLGYVGSTGRSTGCHLHLMLWLDGRLVDPMTWW